MRRTTGVLGLVLGQFRAQVMCISLSSEIKIHLVGALWVTACNAHIIDPKPDLKPPIVLRMAVFLFPLETIRCLC